MVKLPPVMRITKIWALISGLVNLVSLIKTNLVFCYKKETSLSRFVIVLCNKKKKLLFGNEVIFQIYIFEQICVIVRGYVSSFWDYSIKLCMYLFISNTNASVDKCLTVTFFLWPLTFKKPWSSLLLTHELYFQCCIQQLSGYQLK